MDIKETKGLCAKIKPDGEPCGANARRGSKYCFFHDPEAKDERKAARRAGGISRTKPDAVLPPSIRLEPARSLDELKDLISKTILFTLRGQVSPKVANAVGQLVNIYLRTEVIDKVTGYATGEDLRKFFGRSGFDV